MKHFRFVALVATLGLWLSHDLCRADDVVGMAFPRRVLPGLQVVKQTKLIKGTPPTDFPAVTTIRAGRNITELLSVSASGQVVEHDFLLRSYSISNNGKELTIIDLRNSGRPQAEEDFRPFAELDWTKHSPIQHTDKVAGTLTLEKPPQKCVINLATQLPISYADADQIIAYQYETIGLDAVKLPNDFAKALQAHEAYVSKPTFGLVPPVKQP